MSHCSEQKSNQKTTKSHERPTLIIEQRDSFLNTKLSDFSFLFYERIEDDVVSETSQSDNAGVDNSSAENASAGKLIEKVPANRNVLAAISEVFYTMFYGSLKEKGDVKIVDSSVESFKEFLQCFYMKEGTFKNENIQEILYLADKYDVNDICFDFLQNSLSPEHVLWAYKLITLHRQPILEDFANEILNYAHPIYFLRMNFSHVTEKCCEKF